MNTRGPGRNDEQYEAMLDRVDTLISEFADSEQFETLIQHQQIGKGRARSLGREFREIGLGEAYVTIYDGQVVATAPTESTLRETLSEIVPGGKETHPYIYHYDP